MFHLYWDMESAGSLQLFMFWSSINLRAEYNGHLEDPSHISKISAAFQMSKCDVFAYFCHSCPHQWWWCCARIPSIFESSPKTSNADCIESIPVWYCDDIWQWGELWWCDIIDDNLFKVDDDDNIWEEKNYAWMHTVEERIWASFRVNLSLWGNVGIHTREHLEQLT